MGKKLRLDDEVHTVEETAAAGKVTVDLSGWDWGLWPWDLKKCFEVELAWGEVTFKPNLELFEKMVEKIASEAVQAFFETDCWVTFGARGLVFQSDAMQEKQEWVVPLAQVNLAGEEGSAKAVEDWLRSEKELFGEEEGEGSK